MFREVWTFCTNGIIRCIELTKTLILDNIGGINITYYSFLLFLIFIPIIIKLIGFIKQIQEVEEENFNKQQQKAYNEWLRDHPSTPRRFKK